MRGRFVKLSESDLDDLRLRKLSPDTFSAWIFLLLLRSRYSDGLPDKDDLARLLWLTPRKFSNILAELIRVELVIERDGSIEIENWSERQPLEEYEEIAGSPSVGAARTRRYRARKASHEASHEASPLYIYKNKNKNKNYNVAFGDANGVTQENSEGEFRTLCEIFPRRSGCSSTAANRAWVALMERGIPPAQILDEARHFARSDQPKDPKFRPFLANWLREGTWSEPPSGTSRIEAATLVRVDARSANGAAWISYHARRSRERRSKLALAEYERAGHWSEPSEWPPGAAPPPLDGGIGEGMSS